MLSLGFAVAFSVISGVLLWNASVLDRGIKSGQLKITLGEDLDGYSYQHAASLVLGYVSAFAAIVAVAVALSHMGTYQRF